MISATADRARDLWHRMRGHDEATELPDLAALSDHDIGVWAESKRHAWTVNTMVLATIRDRLQDPETAP